MDKQQVIQIAQQDPNVGRAAEAIEKKLGNEPLPPEALRDFIALLEAAFEDPRRYPDLLRAAVADGMMDPGDMPQQYDATFILALLVVFYRLQERGAQAQRFARGGLARAGRFGDTMLAHINPQEAAMLRARGGAGTINPHTGLPEYWSLKSVLKVAAPIVLSVVAPGIGTAIGTALGATGTAAAVLGSAVIGGVTSGLSGGDPLKGAVLGGLTGGLGTSLGSGVSDSLGLGLGQAGQSMLGSGLVGAGASALTGGNPLKGAAMGALGAAAGNALQGMGSGAVGTGIGAGGVMAGNMLAAGYKPREAILGGGLAGLATGLMSGARPAPRASEVTLSEMRDTPSGIGQMEFSPGQQAINPETGDVYYPAGAQAAPGAPVVTSTGLSEPPVGGSLGEQLGGLSPMKLLAGATVFGALSKAPPPVQAAVAQMPPQQQEYFNRPSRQFDWGRIQADATASGMDLSQFMARNWSKIANGNYSMDVPAPAVQAKARGGALSAVAGQLMSGGGSGRDDTIPARLSDGEYVMDAETVALLGDGSNKAGARRLDEMRQRIRTHKGKTLARGGFSPDAKSPLAYLKGMK